MRKKLKIEPFVPLHSITFKFDDYGKLKLVIFHLSYRDNKIKQITPKV